MSVYIPIWLDLLLVRPFRFGNYSNNLHSNMVRFIICEGLYIIWSILHLHSNMVRFIIFCIIKLIYKFYDFTFQYGQIYYINLFSIHSFPSPLYIPIWLDLLFQYLNSKNLHSNTLHSNMVRFIIYWHSHWLSD